MDGHSALRPDTVVAVRSPATGADGSDALLAGMNATVSNISGEDALRTRGNEHRVHRRAARFSHPDRLPLAA